MRHSSSVNVWVLRKYLDANDGCGPDRTPLDGPSRAMLRWLRSRTAATNDEDNQMSGPESGGVSWSRQTEVFTSGYGGYNTYRIPSLAVATDGTVLAF